MAVNTGILLYFNEENGGYEVRRAVTDVGRDTLSDTICLVLNAYGMMTGNSASTFSGNGNLGFQLGSNTGQVNNYFGDYSGESTVTKPPRIADAKPPLSISRTVEPSAS